MGLSKTGMMDAIEELTEEIDKATMQLIKEKKSSIEIMKKYQEAIIDLEARYQDAFVDSVEDLAGRISEKEKELTTATDTQKKIVSQRREDTETPTKKDKDDTQESE